MDHNPEPKDDSEQSESFNFNRILLALRKITIGGKLTEDGSAILDRMETNIRARPIAGDDFDSLVGVGS